MEVVPFPKIVVTEPFLITVTVTEVVSFEVLLLEVVTEFVGVT